MRKDLPTANQWPPISRRGNIAEVTTAVAKGDLREDHSRRPRRALEVRTRSTLMVDQLSCSRRKSRVARRRAPRVNSARPACAEYERRERSYRQRNLAANLTTQVQHRGSDDGGGERRFSRKRTVDVRGEILEVKNTVNTMVDQLLVRGGGYPRGSAYRGQTRRSGQEARRPEHGRTSQIA
jgi:HAMP domain-containing protein